MFLPERYRLQPWRCPMTTAFEPAPDAAIEPDTTAEPDVLDEADELAAMPDEEFYRELSKDIDGVAAGPIAGGREDAHPTPKDRPWSPKRKRRERYGRAF